MGLAGTTATVRAVYSPSVLKTIVFDCFLLTDLTHCALRIFFLQLHTCPSFHGNHHLDSSCDQARRRWTVQELAKVSTCQEILTTSIGPTCFMLYYIATWAVHIGFWSQCLLQVILGGFTRPKKKRYFSEDKLINTWYLYLRDHMGSYIRKAMHAKVGAMLRASWYLVQGAFTHEREGGQIRINS